MRGMRLIALSGMVLGALVLGGCTAGGGGVSPSEEVTMTSGPAPLVTPTDPDDAPTNAVTVTPAPSATAADVVAACSQVTTLLADVMADPDDLLGKVVGGDLSALEPLIALAEQLGVAATEVTEPTVKAAVERASSAYTAIADVVAQLSAMDLTDPASLETARALVVANFAALQDASASLTDLKALCPGI